MTEKKQTTNMKEEIICKDVDCPIHGNLKTRGRVFEGKVIKKFHKRIAIELQKMIYIKKYERYATSRTRIHARLPTCQEKKIELGDLVQIKECRPLSKIIHFVYIDKVQKQNKEKKE
jgi:small subunit ribosomal protein S17